ncbi:MAG: Tn3 family transposase [Steroidobacteraceae bacterium]
MPVSFLSPAQRAHYGRFTADPSIEELARYFHLDDADRAVIAEKRGDHNRLGFALQLTTVRFLGTFLDNPTSVPAAVLQTLGKQLAINAAESLADYAQAKRRFEHAEQIRIDYGYREFNQPAVGFRLSRWLYAQCWTGTERPSVLFDRATTWMLAQRVLLPGASVLERFVARLRDRVEERLWTLLGRDITEAQQSRLEALLHVPDGARVSELDELRTGPVVVSSPALVRALERLKSVRSLGIVIPQAARIPPSRIASLARFADKAKASAVLRLPKARRLATLVAFVHTLEASAQDDAIELLEMLLTDVFGEAHKEHRKTRLRTLKDLDALAITLVEACTPIVDTSLPDAQLRTTVFALVSRETLVQTLQDIGELVSPPDDVFFQELQKQHRRVRRFMPSFLEQIRFCAVPAGADLLAALDHLRDQPSSAAPLEVVPANWRRHVGKAHSVSEKRAYTFCVLDQVRTALKRRDVYVSPSWRYADPRSGLLDGGQWQATRPMICRTLDLPLTPEPMLAALSVELDHTYRAVAARLPQNPDVHFERVEDRNELILTQLDKLDEPASLLALRAAVDARLPVVDLPEIILEIAARTRFPGAFTHISERTARAADLDLSICAVLLAEACNTGLEPLVRSDVPALRRDRLSWVNQNYLRDDTLLAANALLVAAQNDIPLAHAWGGGEVASADGIRFVVPVKTIHAGPNPKYYGIGRGVTYYNLVSNQFTGLHGITVPGTLRDSLLLLALVLEQQTELQPTQIMTDNGAYSDVVFGLFRLLGYRFSPRLADIGGTRFWRIDPQADYGDLNDISRHRANPARIAENWDDMLRLAGSLKLGRVRATGIMRTLQVGERATRLAQGIAELGRIDKTLHTLTFIDDPAKRRSTLVQLNRGEGRHGLSRVVFHGKRGELRQRYREGQEDQLGALGLVVNMIVLWNTIYMQAALDQLRAEGFPVLEADVVHLNPHVHDHINMLGRYSFAVPESVARGELRPLRNPADEGP